MCWPARTAPLEQVGGRQGFSEWVSFKMDEMTLGRSVARDLSNVLEGICPCLEKGWYSASLWKRGSGGGWRDGVRPASCDAASGRGDDAKSWPRLPGEQIRYLRSAERQRTGAQPVTALYAQLRGNVCRSER